MEDLSYLLGFCPEDTGGRNYTLITDFRTRRPGAYLYNNHFLKTSEGGAEHTSRIKTEHIPSAAIFICSDGKQEKNQMGSLAFTPGGTCSPLPTSSKIPSERDFIMRSLKDGERDHNS